MEETAAGLIVRRGNELSFVPAEHVQQILPPPTVSKVPAAHFGMALVSGRVVPTIEVGFDPAHALLCTVDGYELCLLGLSVVTSGFFQTRGGAVRFEGRSVLPLDLDGPLRVLTGRFPK